ncbi:MAG TPA: protein kinase [Acidobacteriota bacterium]|nr:protein kinase [Acidobacteriota bacterium]
MSPLHAGQMLAHYRVDGPLGAGGMGEVYKALDTKLGRLVAIKVLAPAAVADPNARRRLIEEARAAAALTHPHIVTIYSVDEAGGADLIVMEYVEGQSLKERLAAGPLEPAELIRLGIEVSEALGAAHAIGLVHRDIKPANILLTASGAAKVLDFGIAKRMESATAETLMHTATSMTGSGQIIGTVAYMSPEQARGETLDGRADVFSLGATLYEAATGRQAFEGSTLVDVMVAVATKDPPRATVIRPELPADLDEILARAMAKSRDERFESARSLADAMRGLRDLGDTFTGTATALGVAPSAVPHNLPTPLTSFVGRSRERGEVRRLLANGRLITLLGPGGSGKTRLAIQVAKEVLGDFPDGVWLAELEALADPTHVGQEVARAAGAQEEPGVPAAATVAKHLASKTALLVLDNCEHVASAVAPLVAAVLRSAPNTRILATSREALGVPGEISWRVPMLAVPDPGSAAGRSKEAAGRFEAVRLFVDRAQAIQPAFALTDANASTVVRICHRLDGIPLAIELAAVRVKVLPVEQILARLQDRFALLTGGSRTALPRQQTLRAAVDWSYELLSEQERKLLNRISVFSGGFSLEAAETVCAWNGLDSFEVLDLLSPLVDKSLVTPQEAAGSARYTLLETIRDYAAERLKAAGESDAQGERHAAHFLELALRAEPELQGPDQAVWFALLGQENENLRHAMKWYAARGDAPSSLRLSGSLWRYWWTRGTWEEGRTALREALGLAAGAGPSAERAKALYAAAAIAGSQGDLAAADRDLAESLAIARALDEKPGIANALFEQGNLANEREDLERAETLYGEALEIRRAIADRRGASLALHNLAVVAQARGDAAHARALFEEALVLHRELGNATMEAFTLNGLSDVAIHAGDLELARGYLERGLAMQRELGNKEGIAFSHRQLGEIAVRQRDASRARLHLGEGLGLSEEMGDTHGLLDLLDAIAGFAAMTGAHREALALEAAGTAWRATSSVSRAEPDQRDLARALAPSLEALGGGAEAARANGRSTSPAGAVALARSIVGESSEAG